MLHFLELRYIRSFRSLRVQIGFEDLLELAYGIFFVDFSYFSISPLGLFVVGDVSLHSEHARCQQVIYAVKIEDQTQSVGETIKRTKKTPNVG